MCLKCACKEKRCDRSFIPVCVSFFLERKRCKDFFWSSLWPGIFFGTQMPKDAVWRFVWDHILIRVSAVKTLYIGIKACSMGRSMMFRGWIIQFHLFFQWSRNFDEKFPDWSMSPWGWKIVKSLFSSKIMNIWEISSGPVFFQNLMMIFYNQWKSMKINENQWNPWNSH